MLLASLANYQYGDKTLLDFFAKTKAQVENDGIETLYPMAACLTKGQISALDESVGLYQMVQEAYAASIVNNNNAGIMAEIKKRFMENPGQYPDLQSVVLPQLTPEEKNDMANRIWTTIRSKRGDMWQMFNPAQLFLECGFVPAFVQIALISPYVRNYDNSKIRLIEKYSPVGIMDLQDWVIKNYGNIVFDSKTKKFVAGDRKEQKK